MADESPKLDPYWCGQVDARIEALTGALERERTERLAQDSKRDQQFSEDRKERKQYNEGVRAVVEAQTEAVRTLTNKLILPEVRAHAELIDGFVPTINESKKRLDAWEPTIKAYAEARIEAAGRLKLATGDAALWGALGAGIMWLLTWLAGGHFPKP
jgi:hypothetical protein